LVLFTYFHIFVEFLKYECGITPDQYFAKIQKQKSRYLSMTEGHDKNQEKLRAGKSDTDSEPMEISAP